MTGFSVQPAALDTFAALLDQPNSPALASKYLIDANNYVAKYIKLDGDSGGLAFQHVVGAMNQFADIVTTANTAICDTLEQSASGLTASADDYRKQEYATAKHLDDVYHSGTVTPLSDEVDTEDPAVDPLSKLTEPSTEGAIPEAAQAALNAAGYFSESELTIQIVKFVFGFDAEQWVKDRLAGDYEALAKCMNAVSNLAQFNEAVATDLADAAKTMFTSWTGHAAQAAKSYFDQLANGIADFASMMGEVHNHLQAVCVAIQQASDSIALLLGAALDKLLEVLASAGVNLALQAVPGLDIILDAFSTTKIVQVIRKVKELTDKWNLIWAGLQGTSGVITGLVGVFSGYDISVKLPDMGYSNASQGGPPDTSGGESGKEHVPQ